MVLALSVIVVDFTTGFGILKGGRSQVDSTILVSRINIHISFLPDGSMARETQIIQVVVSTYNSMEQLCH